MPASDPLSPAENALVQFVAVKDQVMALTREMRSDYCLDVARLDGPDIVGEHLMPCWQRERAHPGTVDLCRVCTRNAARAKDRHTQAMKLGPLARVLYMHARRLKGPEQQETTG